jgi:hypothetical protein
MPYHSAIGANVVIDTWMPKSFREKLNLPIRRHLPSKWVHRLRIVFAFHILSFSVQILSVKAALVA